MLHLPYKVGAQNALQHTHTHTHTLSLNLHLILIPSISQKVHLDSVKTLHSLIKIINYTYTPPPFKVIFNMLHTYTHAYYHKFY